MSEENAERRRKEERRRIEEQLHPPLEIGGFTVRHEHVGRKIRFTAWKGDDRLHNGKELRFDRSDVLKYRGDGEFYREERRHFEWLINDLVL